MIFFQPRFPTGLATGQEKATADEHAHGQERSEHLAFSPDIWNKMTKILELFFLNKNLICWKQIISH